MAWKVAEITGGAYCAPLPISNREKHYGKFTRVKGGHRGVFVSELRGLSAAVR